MKNAAIMLKRCKWVLIIFTFFICFQNSVYAADVKLRWDANTESDLAGYNIYYGTESETYGPPIEITFDEIDRQYPEYTVPGLEEGETYYFSVTAFDTEDLEGAFSNEESTTIPHTAPTTYTIAASAGANGSISPEGDVSTNHGDDRSFTITSETGYQVSYVSVDGSSVGRVSAYTFNNVTQNHTISVIFESTGSPPPQDSDGDGVPDDQDDFPFDSGESVDTDQDGTGNNADLDDDGDLMPDDWEIQYGLNPLVDDSSEDLDLDGVNNLNEYRDGTDPTIAQENNAPEQPVLFSPVDESVDVSLTPELQTEAFIDPDNYDTHLKTRWQISLYPDFQSQELILDRTTSPIFLTSVRVPELVLDQHVEYYWRVKFFDNHQLDSQWSAPFFFTTIEDLNSDSDRNGIPDDQEVDNTVDLDGDGSLDIEQSDIKCINTISKEKQIGIKGTSNVKSICALKTTDTSDLLDAGSSPENMPFGAISFKLEVYNSGDTAEVTIFFSEPAPADAVWYKYDDISGWEDYSDHSRFSEDRLSIILELVDGGVGDADGTPNGMIVDPGGLGVWESIPSDGVADVALNDSAKDSSGCFIRILP